MSRAFYLIQLHIQKPILFLLSTMCILFDAAELYKFKIMFHSLYHVFDYSKTHILLTIMDLEYFAFL